jgi:hypothetical protein
LVRYEAIFMYLSAGLEYSGMPGKAIHPAVTKDPFALAWRAKWWDTTELAPPRWKAAG